MASKKNSKQTRWVELAEELQKRLPNLAAVYNDPGVFRGLSVNARDDGTLLAIVRGYGPDGGPVVCFGNGYDIAAALLAVDASLQGGHWKADKFA